MPTVLFEELEPNLNLRILRLSDSVHLFSSEHLSLYVLLIFFLEDSFDTSKQELHAQVTPTRYVGYVDSCPRQMSSFQHLMDFELMDVLGQPPVLDLKADALERIWEDQKHLKVIINRNNLYYMYLHICLYNVINTRFCFV